MLRPGEPQLCGNSVPLLKGSLNSGKDRAPEERDSLRPLPLNHTASEGDWTVLALSLITTTRKKKKTGKCSANCEIVFTVNSILEIEFT